MMQAALEWIGRAMSDGVTGSPSIKRVGLALVVVTGCLFVSACAGAILALVIVHRNDPDPVGMLREIGSTATVALGIIATAVTTGYVAGKAVENKAPRAP